MLSTSPHPFPSDKESGPQTLGYIHLILIDPGPRPSIAKLGQSTVELSKESQAFTKVKVSTDQTSLLEVAVVRWLGAKGRVVLILASLPDLTSDCEELRVGSPQGNVVQAIRPVGYDCVITNIRPVDIPDLGRVGSRPRSSDTTLPSAPPQQRGLSSKRPIVKPGAIHTPAGLSSAPWDTSFREGAAGRKKPASSGLR